MDYIKINGGNPLYGSLKVQGSKNAVLPTLAATILNRGTTVLHNCPNLSDVRVTIEILKFLGCKIKRESDTVIIDAKDITNNYIPHDLMNKMRSSIIFMGAIIARTGEAAMSFPGGCELGPRPIDLHLKALKTLGVDIKESHGYIKCRLEQMVDNNVHLDFPSVGATENIMLFASLSEGKTTIYNAAREPEIEDLQCFLNEMGAKINGAGSSTIEIEGVKSFHDCTHIVIPDRIAASTYLCGAVAAGGEIELESVCPEHFSAVTSILSECGAKIETGDNSVYIKAPEIINKIDIIRTLPYPGFPTDAQSIMMSVLALANGTSIIKENIFEQRFKTAGELAKMGADISVDGKVAVIKGVKNLTGSTVYACDLRSGAALAVAALAANGTSKIFNTHFIDRGYESLHSDFKKLGADIERIYQ
ncbi:MAG: UDP-N-acetylglucosamine 1-carboxyvinyltransferase [Clostridia bacterium]|nr:UDP-N-acetylglucosamine 1-carboxyvinyltransferase [Clostridia bacterium]